MTGKLYWITGASSGIGAALSLKLAALGHRVAISARSKEKLAAVSASCAKDNKDNLTPYPLDVTDYDQTRVVLTRIESELGAIDTAILNAGTYAKTPVDTFRAHEVETMMRVNVLGVAYALEALMPRMIERGQGCLALMASVAGYRGLPFASAYSGSKAAIIAMGESLKAELDGKGVKLHVISPGFVRTPLTDQNEFPMPFLMEPDQAAERIIKGLERDQFDISFPKRFAWQLQILRKLPDPLFFKLIKKTVGL